MPELFLNINKKKFFENYSSSKRPLENATFASISAKRPRLGIGQPLRVSAKSRNASSSFAFKPQIGLRKDLSSFKPIKTLPKPKKISSGSSKLGITSSLNAMNESLKEIKSNSLIKDHSPKKIPDNIKKGKVSFKPQPDVFTIDELPINVKKQKAKKKSIAPKDEEPFYSSLFTKSPTIPEMAKVDVKPVQTEVFSTKSFQDLDLAPQIVSNLKKYGCTSMTMVQHCGIPPILEGKDALIKSQTGSGKTLAYAVPIVQHLMKRVPKVTRTQGLFALIIVPTRELAIQTYQWIENLCKSCVWVVPGYLMGGEKKKSEKTRLRKGLNILVATPGRLTDHINNTSCLSLSKVRFLVLDEADRMLEMGYEQSIKGILYSLNEQQEPSSDCQTILLSATLTGAVEKLAGMSLKNPKIVDITSTPGDGELSSNSLVTPQNLSHFFMMVPPKLRLVALAAFILNKCKFTDEKKMLIFMTTQDMVDYHTSLFSTTISRLGRKRKKGVSIENKEALAVLAKTKGGKKQKNQELESDSEEEMEEDQPEDVRFFKLHGNMSQPERTAVFKSFCEADSGVLLSTDVASRGLDLPRVNWIVQYNAACGASEYVHRVGRTARADAKGSAVVFINPTEAAFVSMLEKQGIKFVGLQVEEILKTLMRKKLYHSDVVRIPRSMEEGATFLQNQFEDLVAEDSDLHNSALQGYVSFVRSYAAIPKDLREFFCFKLLHLGHYAKSFGLRETPAVLGNKGLQHKKREYRHNDEKEREYVVRRDKPLPRPSNQLFAEKVSEFDSGLAGIDEQMEKRRKKNKAEKNRKGQQHNNFTGKK